MKTIAVLLTCHNRKEKTLICLKYLFNCSLPKEHAIDVYLVDDGCTDGTPQAIREQFPQVNIIQGDGNLYWNRGMHLAWETAAKAKNYDYYLWLNDDTNLYPNALEKLIYACSATGNNALICSTLQSAITYKSTYGGRKSSQLLIPNGELQECESMNGNCVLVPHSIYEKVGNLDYVFRHAIGDLDYGYRVRQAGFRLYVSSNYLGTCENNPSLPKWCLKSTPFYQRVKSLYSPLSYAEPIPFFIYEKRHFGLLVAIKHFISIHIRLIFPQLCK
ncbi:MAG: N-acetylglucosaminyl-diphospho-decaprenol L-rhamnosyltransferase [Candidatus Ordinivivax streblomastigis]|uniref:N-acetylglucosaminyl-diphospho-decaprenol L-rhamnosyltransferase n=1 Tax=Candidatus Ordinivivax streblomastigis TaxID=2540710 RepID=A0A5M8P638_9BACT|nr:MAG: N-acetylglucosaminyl-diphospho-decaprenol L-rhamnosyltransferase [Candidatus Ordinivivax streblomastigis]